jgi:riboflavin biosynthesis pyrimidine reductase
MTVVMQQIFPGATAEPDLDALYVSVARPRPAGRPWVAVVMIASVDGATVVNGVSGSLGNATDQKIFLTMRRRADLVLVGSRTVAAEGYRPSRKPGQRIAVVSGSGKVDTTTELFTSGGALLVTSTTSEVPGGVDVIRSGVGQVDLAGALAQLDVDMVTCEGGSTLNGSMVAAGLVDEVCLTVSPALVGGTSARVASNPGAGSIHGLRLAHVIEDQGFLYLRYLQA